MKESKRIILVGRAASGKDFIRKKLEGQGFKYAVSYTTRPPRPGEVDGKDYIFLTPATAQDMIDRGDFYEWVIFNSWVYGTTTEQFYNDESPEHKKNLERIDNYLNQILLWLDDKDEKFVYWLDLYAKSIQFNITPLSVAEPFKKIREDHQLNWLFTSATLTVDNSFEHFKENLGLNDAREKSYPSPFDYQKNAMLYVPEGMPEPNDSNFNIYLVNKMLPLIEACHGRTFILSTSLKGVAEITAIAAASVAYDWLAVLAKQAGATGKPVGRI